MKKLLLVMLILLTLLLGCTNYKQNYSNDPSCYTQNCDLPDNLTCGRSCEDNNSCTRDFCNKETNFECRHELKSCNDGNRCTTDSCSPDTGNCVYKFVTPCCGNGGCEQNEDYFNCQKDCQLRKEDCIKTDGIRFKNIHSLCKDYQILECKKSALCFLFLAEDYKDAELCEYIKYPDTDWFWYCKARLDYGKSACSYIDSEGILEDCLKYAK